MSNTHTPIQNVQLGQHTAAGWTYISEPAEQPDGSWTIMAMAPSGARHVLDFANGDADAEVVA